MKFNKNFKEIILNREQFNLKDYIIFIEEVEEPVNITLSLIAKYDLNKAITSTANVVVTKNSEIKPLTYFNRLFLYHGSYGEPIEYELIFRTDKEIFFDKTYIKYEEV